MGGCEESVGVLVGWWKCVLRGCCDRVVFHEWFTQKRLFCPKEDIHKTQKPSKTHISTYLPFPERSPSRVRQDPDVKPAAILSHFEMPLFLSNQAYSEREMAPFLLLHGTFPLDHWPGKNPFIYGISEVRFFKFHSELVATQGKKAVAKKPSKKDVEVVLVGSERLELMQSHWPGNSQERKSSILRVPGSLFESGRVRVLGGAYEREILFSPWHLQEPLPSHS